MKVNIGKCGIMRVKPFNVERAFGSRCSYGGSNSTASGASR